MSNAPPVESQADMSNVALPRPIAPTAPAVAAEPGLLSRIFSLDNRYLAPVLVTVILLVGQITYGVLESWTQSLLAIAVAIGCEMVLGKLITGKIPHLASAYISGISVGILIRSPLVWPFALCAAISITSKYVLRWENRHIWNPSNFGVSAMLFLYPAAVASLSIQWGNFMWPMLVVWALGSMIIYRLKRFHICATYVACFVALAGLRSLITGGPFWANVAPLTGPMYQLYIFFMITDPRTTVSTKRGQCVVVALVALVEMALRLGEVIHAPYYALFLVGPPALLWDLARKKRQGQAVHQENSELAPRVSA